MTYTPPEKDFLFGDAFGDIFGSVFGHRTPANSLHNSHVRAYYTHIFSTAVPQTPKTSVISCITANPTPLTTTNDLYSRIDKLEREVQYLKQLLLKDNHGTTQKA